MLFILMSGWSTYLEGQNNVHIAKEHIRKNLASYGLSGQDISEWYVSDNYVSKHNGVNHIYFQQNVNGIPVEGAVLDVHITVDGGILRSNSRFFPEVHKKARGSASVTAGTALLASLDHLGISAPADPEIKEGPEGDTRRTVFEPFEGVSTDIPVQLIYIDLGKAGIRLAWNATIEINKPEWHIWSVYIDATNGAFIQKRDLVLHCDFGKPGTSCDSNEHFHGSLRQETESESIPTVNNPLFAPDSYLVYPIPVESPSHGSRSTITDPADPVASPFGWHDTNGSPGAEFTITRGNNAHAQEDQDGNNGTGVSPNGGPSLDFIYTLDLTQPPTTNTPAAQNLNSAITNLFYWNNIMHDILYHYGFDEPSGNFQENNYGNGGNGSDSVIADAQDGSGTNNANFNTPSDGTNARMQMFLWTGGGSLTTFDVNSPGGIAGSYTSQGASFGSLNYNITGDLVIADDGTANGSEACGALTNMGAISGNIALIDRGTCEFGTKCLNAENAGAIAVVVCNNVAGSPISMSPGADGGSVTIPCLMISQADCATIRAQIPTVNVTMTGISQAADLDSAFDNGIIAHEYGHGISIRLTGGPGSSCLNGEEQAGEGWSDFFGLFLTHEAGDTRDTPRGIGTYADGQNPNGGGIRTHPYTTDMTVNPFTYDDIKTESIPHGVGSVFCTMIWDLYWNLIDEYGYSTDLYHGTAGNNIAMQLVMDGLKLQGCSPGFVDMRDAILAADQANYSGANECIIWSTFARRGLGFSADQGSSGSRSDGTEAFDLPPHLSGGGIAKTADKTSATEGETITYTLDIQNPCTDLNNLMISDILPADLTYVEGSASNGGTHSAGTITWPTISFLSKGSSRTYTYQATVDAGAYAPPVEVLNDNMESGSGNWTTSNTTGLSNWNLTSDMGSTRWFAEELEATPQIKENQYLVLNPFFIDGLSTMTFLHRFDTEANWDGGTVEISVNNGSTWTDLGPFMTANGYNDFIRNNPSDEAFSGNSGGYITTTVDLSSFCGFTALIRFNFYYDAFVTGNGWYVDDVVISAESALPNTAQTDSEGNIVEAGNCVRVLIPPLSVDWGRFSAEAKEQNIHLDWNTITEKNNKGFEVQRRGEDEPDFRNIGWVDGAGNSQSRNYYNYIDRDVLAGVRYYYRINQLDHDGTGSFSHIEEAMIKAGNETSLLIFPNPAKGNILHIHINGVTDTEDSLIQVFDSTGKLIRSYFASGKHTAVNIEELTGGLYAVKVVGKNFSLVDWLVVNR